MSCVSYVSAEDVRKGAMKWSNQSNFNMLCDSVTPVATSINITPKLAQFLLLNKAQALKRYITNDLQSKNTKVDKIKNTLEITASRAVILRVKKVLSKLEGETEEDVKVQFDFGMEETGKVLKYFGVKNNTGVDKIQFVKRINNMIEVAVGEEDDYVPLRAQDIWVNGKEGKCDVSVRLMGPAKQFVSLVVGAVQSEVMSVVNKGKHTPVVMHPRSVTSSTKMQRQYSNNLAVLSSSSKPACTSGDRNSAMLYVAHAVIWQGGASIYGGFIRDFIVNSDPANDIDCGFDKSKTSLEKLKSVVIAAARSVNLNVLSEGIKGMAYTVKFGVATDQQVWNFEVDLVDMQTVRDNGASPGVDCDVGNLLLEAAQATEFGLKLKVNHPRLVQLADSHRHCLNKQFVFYYDCRQGDWTDKNNVNMRRLIKYFSKGWTCLSALPEPALSWAKAAGYEHLFQFSAQYSKPYY